MFSTPWLFFHKGDIYYFGKVFSGKAPDETGILLSEELEEPVYGVGDTKKIKSDYPAGRGGYFGFQLINLSGDYNKQVHIRPYAVYNGILNAGITHKVDFSGGEGIKGLLPKDTWLSENRLNYAGVKKYSY